MLKERVLSAIILIAIVFVALFFFSPFYLALAVGTVVVLGVWEWSQFLHFKLPFWRLGMTGVAAAFLFLWIYGESHYLNAGRVFEGYISLMLFSSVIWWGIALSLVVTYPKSAVSWGKNKLLQVIFAFFTLVPFLVGVLRLRLDHYVTDQYHGLVLLLYVFILVWSADSGAYFAGRQFGKNKLAPKVSPGKSWEGVFGGLLTAGLLATVFIQFTQQNLLSNVSTPAFILLSVATVAVSILGDLTESMFKRESGIKDSSQLIPGHGGILDRIDSLTAAVPFFAYFYFFVI
ncbi:phosphatidate cytidylyltransferase [Pasteurella canis]|uniref:Phosphatidate cytidylyltransferase n=1 Tax=Pasteurella canis TaxID=753 RepID=A0A379EW55_9PAST|nr:phosphatidate cytidylyltransferase [Pasteurella canis]UAX41491.1 phosphatidate cytidylyltransferase [Pasteurella canis]UAY76997.1 phosphatidate cytidylyltransferase [Pasteurella canis]UEC22570.1 phosphatidate cytidylyltransferase [Pasteurella canis]SPY32141.1 phosphatidate cytidylyltransferase [Pasteurella canis]SUC10374.1 phosphatidate cytidylyltransferase [Pasteurella canis]